MTDDDATNNQLEPNSNRQQPLPVNHRVDSHDEINKLQHEHPEIYLNLVDSVRSTPKRKIIATLVQKPVGVMYTDLENATTIASRTIRHHVKELEESRIVERNSKPTVISFPNEDVEVLAVDVISLVYKTF